MEDPKEAHVDTENMHINFTAHIYPLLILNLQCVRTELNTLKRSSESCLSKSSGMVLVFQTKSERNRCL